MKKFISSTILFLISFILFTDCSGQYAEKDYAEKSALALAILNPEQTEAMKLCQALVVRVNTCIAAGYGFEAYSMCASQNIAGTAEEYGEKLKDVGPAITASNCNLPQYKYRDAEASVASGAAFENIKTANRNGTPITILIVPHQLPEVK
jgi:hypothetical protein